MLILLAAMFRCLCAFGHGEKIEISDYQPKGPIYLTKEQQNIIDLKLVKASRRPMTQSLGLNGEIQLLPNEQADVSVRISGNVAAVYANLGDQVKVDQPLLKVQSRLIGDPPPSIIVYAPIAGIIDARNVNLGQAVEPDTVLFHISNRKRLLLMAKVYEEDLGKVKVGQKASLDVLSYPAKTFTGEVFLIEPNLDSMTRTVNVQIMLENVGNLLKPGMFTRANLMLGENQNALTIPNTAILEANGEKFVFIRQDNKFQRIVIQTGLSNDHFSEVTEGLHAGDEVVVQGNRQLYTFWLTGGGHAAPEKDHH
ncbi:efflux RND transporter periplasmic adaptor subunit [Tatlockia sp. PL877]|nr:MULTISPECIES: efflux RND transporter periplasmic adaptor subunit [unclassified Legionella]MDI9819580.1 efflux RND transporter periplasmic adaptor subunit [Legionella sp. PL877]